MSEPRPPDPDLAEAIASLGRTIQANPHPEPSAPNKPVTAQIIQLPFWPEPVRGAPNALLRSAFFAAIHSKKRKELGVRIKPGSPKKAVAIIAAQEGDLISYAGDQLNQYDADVFFEALHRARHHPLETECLFTGYSFLKAIGRQVSKREYEDLDDSLTRLRDGRVEIQWRIQRQRYKFVGGLIASYVRDEINKLYKVTFAKQIRDLFADACWTQLEWEERMALKRHPLAQWLHSFYSSHVPGLPLSVAYLHEKTGSPRALLKYFKGDLKKALVTLEKEFGWKATWRDDLLILKRPPTGSQLRHLNRKATRLSKRPPKPKSLTLLGDLFPSNR
jgi:TrfA protein